MPMNKLCCVQILSHIVIAVDDVLVFFHILPAKYFVCQLYLFMCICYILNGIFSELSPEPAAQGSLVP